MKKLIDKIKQYLPFILLFMFYFILHYKIYYMVDDIINSGRTYENGMLTYLIDSYNHWSSRLIIYFVNNYMYIFPIIIWKLLDSFIITLGAVFISKIFNDKKNKYLDYVICTLVITFPFIQMGTAGFIATTVTYYWPLVFLLICLYPIKKILNKQNIKPYFYPLLFILLLYATDNEQITCFLFGLSLCFIVYLKFIKKEKVNWYIYFLLIFSILKLIYIKTCPGNEERSIIEMTNRFPLYKTLSFKQKILMGIFYTTNILRNDNLPIVILMLLLCYITNLKNKYSFNKIISILNLLLVISVSLLYSLFVQVFPNVNSYILNIGVSFSEPIYYINYITLLFIVIFYTNTLYLLFINFKDNLLPIILFIGGIATQFIMIFSPTIYASGPRTGSIMFYCIIVINFIMIKQIYPTLNENKKNWIISLLIFLSIISFLTFISIY